MTLKIYTKHHPHQIHHRENPLRKIYGRLRMMRKHRLFTLIVISILLATSFWWFPYIFQPKKTEAAWFDDSWWYRQVVAVTNSGSNQTDFQISITLDTSTLITAGKLKSNCDDLRITDNQGKLLSHWVDPSTSFACNTTTTHIWILAPVLYNPSSYFYIYYGNPSAANVEAPDRIFLFFDNFNDNSVDGSKWTATGTGTKEETGGEQHTANSGSWGHARFYTPMMNINSRIIEFDVRFPVGSGWNQKDEMLYASPDFSTYYWEAFWDSASKFQIYTLQSGAWASRATSSYVFSNNIVYHVKITDTGTSVRFEITEGSTSRYDSGSINRDANTTSHFHIGDGTGGDESYHDNFLIGKSASTAPSAGSPSSEEKSAGPVAFWRFDDGTGTNAQDSSSNNNDGTITGATWQTEDLCISGKCLYFDGVDDLVNAGSATLLDDMGPLTYSAWIKPITSGEGTYGRIIAKINASLVGTSLSMNGSNGLYFIVDRATTTMLCSIATGITLNTWQQVVVTWDGNLGCSGVYFYINGVRQNTIVEANGSGARTSDASSSLYIGNEPDATRTFNGFIDEPKIYNYARSADQIKLDYNNSGINKGAGTRLGSDPRNAYQALNNGLVGYWKMDESSGNAADSSGNGLTLTNNATTTYVAGKFGNGSEHVPASSQYLSTATTITGVKTVSFWTNPDSTTNYFVSLTSGAYVTAASGVLSATGFTSPKIYVNGMQTTTIAADTWQLVTLTTETGISADTFYVGRQGSNYYDGTMDEVRTYNRALSPAEVSQLYNFAPGPVGYWNFEEKQGTTAYDRSGNANDGTLTNSPTYTIGKYGSGLDFAGSNAHVTRADDSDFDFGTGASFSYGAWIKHNTASALEMIIDKYDTTAGNGGFKLRMESDGDLTCGIDDDETSFPEDSATSTAATYDDNVWHYISCVKNGTTGLYLYIDGVLIASDTTISSTGDFANADPLYIGIAEDGTSNDWIGQIDEAKIYNYARTQKQIVEDMNAGHPAPGSPVGSPVGYWKFDEGYGTIAHNSGIDGGNSDGTLTGMASPPSNTQGWTRDGKYGNALKFDQSSSYVQIGQQTAYQTETATITAWVNRTGTCMFDTCPIFAHGTGSNSAYSFNTGSNSLSTYYVSYVNLKDIDRCYGTTTASLNTWYFASASWDSSTIKVYVNGVLENTCARASVAFWYPDPARIGSSGNIYSNLKIDEVKYYNSVLTDEQIKMEYNHGQALNLGVLGTSITDGKTASNSAATAYCVPGDTTSCSAPVAEWKFEEGTGATASDTSGNNATGTATGTAIVSGKVGKARQFTASDNVSATLASDPLFANSVEVWIYPTTSIASKTIITTSKLTTDSSSRPVYGGCTGVPLALNQWTHITAVSTDSTHCTLYQNGVLTASSAATGLSFGTAVGIGQSSFVGTIDQVKIFNYARTGPQVAYDYNRGAPIAHWKFDECQGTTANDSSGNGNTGTITIGASGTQTAVGTCTGSANQAWKDGVAGKFNYSLDFDGTDDYITAAAFSPLAAAGQTTTKVSWGGWFYPTSSAATKTLIEKASEFQLITDSNSKAQCGVYYSAAFHNNTAASTTLSLSAWNHILCVYDGVNITTYLNGIKVGQTTETNSVTAASSILYMGETSGASNRYSGQIDDIKVWAYNLTPQLILMDFNQGSAVRFGPNTGTP